MITATIKQFFTPFNEDEHLSVLRKEGTHPLITQYKLTDDEIKAVWREYGNYCRKIGTSFHSFIQSFYSGEKKELKTIPSYNSKIKGIKHYIPEDKKDFSKEISQFLAFNSFLKEKKGYDIFAVEKKLKSEDGTLTGIVDAIFYNEKKQKYLIIDWKVTKEDFEQEKQQQRVIKIGDNTFDDNKYGMYCFQLVCYKKMFYNEKEGKTKISLKLVQFHETLDSYKIFKVKS